MSRMVALAALGYVVITFVLGFTWHLVLFKDVYESFGVYSRREPIIPMGVASMLIQGLALASLYASQLKANPSGRFSDAIKFNLLMGLFFASGTVLALAAKAEIPHLAAWFGYGAAFSILQFTLSGMVFGWVFHGARR